MDEGGRIAVNEIVMVEVPNQHNADNQHSAGVYSGYWVESDGLGRPEQELQYIKNKSDAGRPIKSPRTDPCRERPSYGLGQNGRDYCGKII